MSSSLYGIAEHFRAGAQADIDVLVDALAHGRAADIEEYRSMTGRITGLEQALQMFNSLMSAAERADSA